MKKKIKYCSLFFITVIMSFFMFACNKKDKTEVSTCQVSFKQGEKLIYGEDGDKSSYIFVDLSGAELSSVEKDVRKKEIIKFRLVINRHYDASKAKVKANGEIIEAEDGIYSIIAVQDTVVTCEGVEKKGSCFLEFEADSYYYHFTDINGKYLPSADIMVDIGDVIKFKLILNDESDRQDTIVKANGEILTAIDGIYSIEIKTNTPITIMCENENWIV